MRFIAYADIHFNHSWPEFNPIEKNGLTRWLNIQVDVWKQIEEYAKKYQVEAKLFAGDLSHKRSFIHTTVNNTILDLYKHSAITEYLIPGNHDRYDQNFDAVQALNGIGQARTVDKCNGVWLGQFREEDKGDTVYLEGCSPGDPLPSTHRHTSRINIALAHGLLQGASAPSGFVFTTGYKSEDLKYWDLVILGDCHKKQIIGNVLIPGSPMQHQWGDSGLECGCWLIDTEPVKSESGYIHINSGISAKFLPIKAPKFIVVTKENIEEILSKGGDDYNYYDFRFAADIDKENYKELRELYLWSYFSVKKEEKKSSTVHISSRGNSTQEILEKYYDLKIKEGHKEEFTKLALKYLSTADPKQISRSHKNINIKHIKALNFLSFKEVFLDLTTLNAHLYQITGTSNDTTSTTNNIGKSTLAVEILSYTLFGSLCRSSTRSKDRLIHDPAHTGKEKNLLCEVKLQVGEQDFLIQRYRKHEQLGTGSRILKCLNS